MGKYDLYLALTYFSRRGLSIYSYPQTIPNSVMFCNDSEQVMFGVDLRLVMDNFMLHYLA